MYPRCTCHAPIPLRSGISQPSSSGLSLGVVGWLVLWWLVSLLLGAEQQLVHGDAAVLCNLIEGLELLEGLHGGTGIVQLAARANALGQHVLHAGQLQHGANGTAGNHTGTVGGGHDDAAGCVVLGLRLVGDGAGTDQGHPDDVLLGVHQGPLDSHGDLTAGLAANTDQAILVADNGHAAEAHDLTTLHNLGDTGELDDALHPLLAIILVIKGHLITLLLSIIQQLSLHVGDLLQLLSQSIHRQLTAGNSCSQVLLALVLRCNIVLSSSQVLIKDGQLLS
mmetsp:Transcript_22518/g.49206  ORF Transcript_22518/g.49206 Transcript_22518/m.49206 type:complete len:280 (-) Transcript_22518:1474-2313(-)